MIFVICQARRGSSRLPDKVMMQACGATLLERQIERMLMAKVFGGTPGQLGDSLSARARLIVATTEETQDDIIAEICQRRGWECFRGHSTDLLDRHYRAALRAGASRGDCVVKIPSDCPLIDPRVIDLVLGSWEAQVGEWDYLSNLHPASYPDGNDVEAFTFEALEIAHKNAVLSLEREHTTPYFWERPQSFRIGNIAWESGLDYSMSHRWTLDYAEDYVFIRTVFEELYPIDPGFSLDAILELLERKPEIAALNQMHAGVNWYRNHLGELKTIGAHQTRRDCK